MANTTDQDSRVMRTRTEYIQGHNRQIAEDTRSQVIIAADLVLLRTTNNNSSP